MNYYSNPCTRFFYLHLAVNTCRNSCVHKLLLISYAYRFLLVLIDLDRVRPGRIGKIDRLVRARERDGE